MEAAVVAERQGLLWSRGGHPEETGPSQLSEALWSDDKSPGLSCAHHRARRLLADEAHNTAIAAIASPECAREVQLHSGDREGNRVHPFLRLCASRYKSTVQTGGLKTSWITSWSKTDMSRSLILDWLARCSRSRLLWRSLARRCCRDLEKTRD